MDREKKCFFIVYLFDCVFDGGNLTTNIIHRDIGNGPGEQPKVGRRNINRWGFFRTLLQLNENFTQLIKKFTLLRIGLLPAILQPLLIPLPIEAAAVGMLEPTNA